MHKLVFLLLILMLGCSVDDQKFESKIPQDAVFSKSGEMYRTGLIIPKDIKKPGPFKQSTLMGLPEEFDWRSVTELSPIEDQGPNCGSCWAFSTAATFQDVMRITKNEKFDLSEQYLLSCAKPGQWTCNGGFFAHDAHMSPKGSVMASEYPYTATDSACKPVIYRWKLGSWQFIAENPTVDQMKTAIYKYGPISVGVAADSAFTSYRGGIFMGSGSTLTNHAVNIVGWGKGFWIVRNSWGTRWGENGWMRIAFGANKIGEWANYVIYDKLPDPTPNPTPQPTPVPPTPVPTPIPPSGCSPQPVADTGVADTIQVRSGQTINLGAQPRKDTVYFWLATPPFNNTAVAQTSKLQYKPEMTKTLKIYAVTRCGLASDSVTVQLVQ